MKSFWLEGGNFDESPYAKMITQYVEVHVVSLKLGPCFRNVLRLVLIHKVAYMIMIEIYHDRMYCTALNRGE